jgi:predicted nucleic acid-binding protein
MAILNKEEKYEEVLNFLKNAQNNKADLIMSSINFGEIYYSVLRLIGEQKADSLYNMITAIPIDIISPDIETVILASRYKAFKKMSYADCFAAALAKTEGAALLTGDPEFIEVEKEIRIIWL